MRQRLTPSASAASLRLCGTRGSTSWLERAISGSMIDGQRERSGEAASGVAGDEQAEDEQPDDDRRQPVEEVEGQPDRRARPGGPANSVVYSATSTPSGMAITVATATSRAVPAIAGPIPPPAAPTAADPVRKSRLSAPAPRDDDRVDDDAEDGHGEHGRGRGRRLGDPADQLAPAEVPRRRQRARVVERAALIERASAGGLEPAGDPLGEQVRRQRR